MSAKVVKSTVVDEHALPRLVTLESLPNGAFTDAENLIVLFDECAKVKLCTGWLQ